jgi:peptidoglycan L-alanyl-D-glutamate endopeptidase CwlK
MSFRLSKRSLDRLNGLHPDLVKVVKRAIEISTVDFGVLPSVRTIEEQKQLVAKGASQTMNSKHLPQSDGYSHAVDVVAYIGSRVSWEVNLYDDIADAFKQASKELDVSVRWGGAWTTNDISKWDGTMLEAQNAYIDIRRKEGKRPFIDAPHFELV